MELIATEAREIDKEKVTDPEYTAVNGKLVTDVIPDEQMKPGDFYLTTRVIAVESPAEPDQNFFSRILNWLFPRSFQELLKTVREAVLSCPFCGMPILIESTHIVRYGALTLDCIVHCPYAPKEFGTPHAFEIKEGKITPA
jgi:hypothetical protein